MTQDRNCGRPRIAEAHGVEHQPRDVRRAHRGDLAIAPDDDRVGVMAGMAPTPERRLLQIHERRDLIERIVQPRGPKRGAVTGLMPTGVRGRPIQHPVDEKQRDAPQARPRQPGRETRHREQDEPHCRVAQRRTIATAHQLLHPLARDLSVIPLGRHETHRLGLGCTRPDQAVIPRLADRRHDHSMAQHRRPDDPSTRPCSRPEQQQNALSALGHKGAVLKRGARVSALGWQHTSKFEAHLVVG
jgi:hypothetical protein